MITSVLVAYFVKSSIAGEMVLVGTLYALYSYTERISGLFFRFAYKYSDITQQKTSVENSEILSNDFIKKDKGSQVKLTRWKALNIDHLTFSYQSNKEELHLRDISIQINKGEKIALIGESGSGKTTFLKLIRGLYKPKKLDLRLGENHLNSFEQISDEIALIPQDPELFTTTIRENITLGIRSNNDEIKKYTDIACFTQVVERLPRKLESNINEKGVNLSGGEKQRLALSRGLIASIGKEIILLDEPTSSVDSKNEMQIYKNIFSTFKDKTVISTIHRLHLLSLFDTIYLFDKGKIIASGNFNEIKKSPKFRELWKKYSVKN
jgi:ABC-type multidrug transport system fused ATPase/permease subunit